MYLRSRKHKVYRGLIAGGIGGLAASWIMPKFQVLLSRALGHSDPHEGQGEDATVRTAQRISSAMRGHQPSAEEEKTAAHLCTTSTEPGSERYTVVLRKSTKPSDWDLALRTGQPPGRSGDEIAVPALGLGKKPTEVPCPSSFSSWPLTLSMASRWKVFAA
jgi:hypothetical protein